MAFDPTKLQGAQQVSGKALDSTNKAFDPTKLQGAQSLSFSPQADKPEEKSVMRKIGDFLTSGTQATAETVGAVGASLTGVTDKIEESRRREADARFKLARQLRFAESEEEKQRIKNLLNQSLQVDSALAQVPALNKSAKQVFGDSMMFGMELLGGGVLELGVKSIGKGAVKKGVKEVVKEGAKTGAGFGAVGGTALALQEDGTLSETVTGAAAGAALGAGLGASLGFVGIAAGKGAEQVSVPFQRHSRRRQKKLQKNINDLVGKITQGKTKDLAASRRALTELDTTGVKTYQDLSSAVDEHIGLLAEKVDDKLNRRPSTRKLEKLTQDIDGEEFNPVVEALNDLDELYTTTRDVKEMVRIRSLKNEAAEIGLSARRINDIAREYGSEFGTKAFSAAGEPRTSVNAQTYENTRTAVKELARGFMPDDATRQLDRAMSDMYTLKRVTDKMVEKVNTSIQKLHQRGLIERFGGGVVEVIDALSGHLLRGGVSKLIPRGRGEKVLQPFELQELLQKNLKNLDKLLAGTDEDVIKALKNPEQAGK